MPRQHRGRPSQDLLPRAIAYLFVGGLGGLFGWRVIHALATGEVRLRRSGVFQQTEDPLWFWMAVTVDAAISVFLLFLLAKGAIRDVKRLRAS